jgi:hypothetical protein
MFDPYALDEALRIERQLRGERSTRLAAWQAEAPRKAPVSTIGSLRRRLARSLLALADRLDPRTVVSVPHVPARSTLNGTLHHA